MELLTLHVRTQAIPVEEITEQMERFLEKL